MQLSESHPDMRARVSCDDIIKIIFTWYLYSNFFPAFLGFLWPFVVFQGRSRTVDLLQRK